MRRYLPARGLAAAVGGGVGGLGGLLDVTGLLADDLDATLLVGDNTDGLREP